MGECEEINFGIDEAYYIYVEKLHHTEHEFWSSSYKKILYIVERYAEELGAGFATVQDSNMITGMKDIAGW
ncbi:MAG: hypothetical protein NC086_05085 [Alistipes sp.]|nr:hypothetical protein [Alistipes sp.]